MNHGEVFAVVVRVTLDARRAGRPLSGIGRVQPPVLAYLHRDLLVAVQATELRRPCRHRMTTRAVSRPVQSLMSPGQRSRRYLRPHCRRGTQNQYPDSGYSQKHVPGDRTGHAARCARILSIPIRLTGLPHPLLLELPDRLTFRIVVEDANRCAPAQGSHPLENENPRQANEEASESSHGRRRLEEARSRRTLPQEVQLYFGQVSHSKVLACNRFNAR